jgi:ribosomal protein L37E
MHEVRGGVADQTPERNNNPIKKSMTTQKTTVRDNMGKDHPALVITCPNCGNDAFHTLFTDTTICNARSATGHSVSKRVIAAFRTDNEREHSLR